MKWGIAAVVALLPGMALSQEGRVLTGAEIAAALTDRDVTYANGATQRFHASGRTLYTYGEPSWGSWQVENDRYCSLWPPAPTWDCYDVSLDAAGGIVFSDDWGNTYVAVYDE